MGFVSYFINVQSDQYDVEMSSIKQGHAPYFTVFLFI